MPWAGRNSGRAAGVSTMVECRNENQAESRSEPKETEGVPNSSMNERVGEVGQVDRDQH